MVFSESQEVAWNLSQAIIEEISELLNASVRNYIKYNLEESFRNLKAIKLIVIANFNEDERKKFVEMEKSLSILLNKQAGTKSGFHKHKQIEFTKEHSKTLVEQLDSYSEFLMDTLKKYGYLIPPKESKTNLNK